MYRTKVSVSDFKKRKTTIHTLIHFCKSVEHLHISLGFLGDSKL